MITVNSIKEIPTRASVLLDAIDANAELVNKPTNDFYRMQRRMMVEVLKEQANVKCN